MQIIQRFPKIRIADSPQGMYRPARVKCFLSSGYECCHVFGIVCAMMKFALPVLINRAAFSAFALPRVSGSRFDRLLIKPCHSFDRKIVPLPQGLWDLRRYGLCRSEDRVTLESDLSAAAVLKIGEWGSACFPLLHFLFHTPRLSPKR